LMSAMIFVFYSNVMLNLKSGSFESENLWGVCDYGSGSRNGLGALHSSELRSIKMLTST
jgi:hypothetical protein